MNRLKIKTFEGRNPEEIDQLVNDFEEKENVKATQTHVDQDKGIYTYIVFYVPLKKGVVSTVKHTIVKG